MTNFVRIGYDGHCTQLTSPWKVTLPSPRNNHKQDASESKTNDLIGQLESIKQNYGEITVQTQNESYKLCNVIPNRFFSSSEPRNLAVFHSIGVPKIESNILRGFKFPFPLSLTIFYGPILAAFIYLDGDDLEDDDGLEIDGMSLDKWAMIIEGWQDMALIRAGTQAETLKPYWTSDTTITEGAITDVESPLDEIYGELDENKYLEMQDESGIDDDGYSTEEGADDSDLNEHGEDDEMEMDGDDQADPELLVYLAGDDD